SGSRQAPDDAAGRAAGGSVHVRRNVLPAVFHRTQGEELRGASHLLVDAARAGSRNSRMDWRSPERGAGVRHLEQELQLAETVRPRNSDQNLEFLECT